MGIPKKITKEFISDVIIPIEQNDLDSGNLYVLIRSQPNQSCTEYEEKPDWAYDREDWSFPTESSPGEWLEDKQITLETLSGLIWRGTVGGRLYEANSEGEKKRVGPRDYWGGHDDHTRTEIEAAKHIDECLSLGFEVKRARLIRRIGNWTPYLLWSFALDCIERAYSFKRDLVSDIYREGIIFARAYSRFRCGMGGLELEELVEVPLANSDFYSLSLNKRDQLAKLISEQSERGSTLYLKKAVVEGFGPGKPFQVANYVRTAMALHYMGEYGKEYEYPSLITKNPEEQKFVNRIWQALHKKELDWQVDYMRMLVGD